MNMDELDLMARLRDEVPLAPDPAIERAVLAAIRDEAAELVPGLQDPAARRPPARPRRHIAIPGLPVLPARPAIAVAVVVAVVAAAAASAGLGFRSAQPAPSGREYAWTGYPAAPWHVTAPSYGTARTAQQLLDYATRSAAALPAAAPRPDQWIAIKTEAADSSAGGGGFLFGPPDDRVIGLQWEKVDRSESAGLEKGIPATTPAGQRVTTKLSISPDGMATAGTLCGWYSVTWSYLASLPIDPSALKRAILAHDKPVVATNGSPTPINNPCYEPDPDTAVFQAIHALFQDEVNGTLIPPRLAAALYGVLRLLPGVSFDSATDLAGRTGLGFSMVVYGFEREEIVIDPATYAYMGSESVAVADHTLSGTDGTRTVRAGQVLGWLALLNLAIVDRPGQLPG